MGSDDSSGIVDGLEAQLVMAHPDKFMISNILAVGTLFSIINHNHTGIVIGWDGVNITVQEGNLNRKTNTFERAK